MAAVNYKYNRKHYRLEKNNTVEKLHFTCAIVRRRTSEEFKFFWESRTSEEFNFLGKAESVTLPWVNILVFVREVIFYSLTKNIMSPV